MDLLICITMILNFVFMYDMSQWQHGQYIQKNRGPGQELWGTPQVRCLNNFNLVVMPICDLHKQTRP